MVVDVLDVSSAAAGVVGVPPVSEGAVVVPAGPDDPSPASTQPPSNGTSRNGSSKTSRAALLSTV